MKAYIRKRYGGPEQIQLQTFQKPTPKPDEILVKVKATSINPADWRLLRGKPFLVKLMIGFPKPKSPFFGADVAGIVESKGDQVTTFSIGDQVVTDVMGTGVGAFSEYVCVKASHWVKIPEGVSIQQAAALPIASLTAWQGLKNHGQLKAGQKVLINGASGGVGHYAVQLAKYLGAEVTAICSTGKMMMVKNIGADHLVDYRHESLGDIKESFDLIFDAVGNISAGTARKLLKPKGKCLLVGWSGFGAMLSYSLGKIPIHLFSGRRLGSYTAKMKTEDLSEICQILASGKIRSVIDKEFTFSELPAAISYQEKGHCAGKVIVNIND